VTHIRTATNKFIAIWRNRRKAMAYGIEDFRKPEVLVGAPMASNTSEQIATKNGPVLDTEAYARGGFGQNTARYNEMNPQQLTAKSSVSAATPWAAGGGSLISPELQGIIDKVSSSSSSMSPRQRNDLTQLAGVVGGLQQNRTNEQGKMAQLGVAGANALKVQALHNVGAKETQTIASTPGLLAQTKPPIPGSGKAVDKTKTDASAGTGGVGESIHDTWKSPGWNIFGNTITNR
jgi:hypothetical protein